VTKLLGLGQQLVKAVLDLFAEAIDQRPVTPLAGQVVSVHLRSYIGPSNTRPPTA
jgi:hypothetical protein